MYNIQINLTSLALILWSGMLVIAGSIWVLCSQVRKLADHLDEHSRRTAAAPAPVAEIRLVPAGTPARSARRGGPVRVRGVVRSSIAQSRTRALPAPRGADALARSTAFAERLGNRSEA